MRFIETDTKWHFWAGPYALVMILLCMVLLPPAQAQTRVNCGGPAYTDSKGNTWQADTGFNFGVAYSSTSAISGTPDSTLFQTQRYSNPSQMTYTFTVPNGSYTVNLLFAELYFTAAGQRVFNVKINGTQVLTNFDVFAKAGKNAADTESFPVTGSSIAIEFDNVMNYAIINAIDIESASQQTIPLSMSFPGSGAGQGFTITVNQITVPQCVQAKDGDCSLSLQITDANGNVVATLAPGSRITLSIQKTFALPVQQTATSPVATVTSP